MSRLSIRALLVFALGALAGSGQTQQIQSTYGDLALPGNWQEAKQFAAAHFGSDIYFDPGTGALVQISQQAGMQKVGEIAKFFGGAQGTSTTAAEVMSEEEFPLPLAYTEKAAKDLAKGSKPPKMWDMKEGEGNPLWFYASQLFDDYHIRDVGGSSEVREDYQSVRVNKAEQRPVAGGDVLVFEIETDKPANEPALKRFRMPPALKEQRIRYGWVQFAPGGIASGQGVLSVGFATAGSSKLSVDDVVKQMPAAKIKPMLAANCQSSETCATVVLTYARE